MPFTNGTTVPRWVPFTNGTTVPEKGQYLQTGESAQQSCASVARERRIVFPGVPYHVVQRASHQAFILSDDHERAVLMRIMLAWQARTAVDVAAFVIMGNHFHLVAVSPTKSALSEFMAGVCGDFSRYYNLRQGRSGPNWQGRFYAAPMDDLHAVSSIRYIERNPIAANMVEKAWDWHWSSAAFHVGQGERPKLLTVDLRPAHTSAEKWRRQLEIQTDPELQSRLQRATRSGRAFGAAEWARAMDRAMGKPPARGSKRESNLEPRPDLGFHSPANAPTLPLQVT